MARIRISADSIRHVANQFTQAAEESKHTASRLQGQMSALSAEWEGVMKASFYQDWQHWHSDTLRGSDLLSSIAQQLYIIAARFEAADQG